MPSCFGVLVFFAARLAFFRELGVFKCIFMFFLEDAEVRRREI